MDKNKLKCPRCNKVFKFASKLNIHVNGKTKCKSVHACNVCGLDFCNKYALKKHVTGKCNSSQDVNSINIENSENISIANTANTTNIGTANINITLPVDGNNLIPYKSEDLSFITDETFANIMDRGIMSIPTLVNYIHFNNHKPEYHNIKITQDFPRHVSSFSKMDENQRCRWFLNDKNSAIAELIEDKFNILNEKYEELKKQLPYDTGSKFDDFSYKKDSQHIKDDIIDEISKILYNDIKINDIRRKVKLNTKKNKMPVQVHESTSDGEGPPPRDRRIQSEQSSSDDSLG